MSQRAMVRDSILILVLFSQLTVFCCVLVAKRAVFLSVNALLLHRPSQPASVLFFSSRVFERLLSRSLSFVFYLFIIIFLALAALLMHLLPPLNFISHTHRQPNSAFSHASRAIAQFVDVCLRQRRVLVAY